MKIIFLIYVLSSLFMIGVRAVVKVRKIEKFKIPESDWMFQIFTPGLNTMNMFYTIFILSKTLIKKHFLETWQLFPTVQYRNEPEENCFFIVVALPVFGSFIFRFERKVKETEDSHHAE
jgi:hypothetical protein